MSERREGTIGGAVLAGVVVGLILWFLTGGNIPPPLLIGAAVFMWVIYS